MAERRKAVIKLKEKKGGGRGSVWSLFSLTAGVWGFLQMFGVILGEGSGQPASYALWVYGTAAVCCTLQWYVYVHKKNGFLFFL